MNHFKILAKLGLATLIVSAGAVAVAGPTCTQELKSKWMDENQFKQQLTDVGYTIKKFKVTSGNCYEIYGYDKAGNKKEIYFHPISGEAVESH